MENAAEALKMAGGVLLFLIALSVSIISFGQVRQTADTIFSSKDRETEYIDGDYYYQVGDGSSSERTVGLETILPTISRVYAENYKIIFEGLNDPIYTVIKSGEKRICLDGEFDNAIRGVGTENEKQFLNAVLYGDKGGANSIFNLNFSKKIRLPNTSLYTQLTRAVSNGKIIEYSGRYYQDDEVKTNESGSSSSTEDEPTRIGDDVPDANKTRKRVITYKIIT